VSKQNVWDYPIGTVLMALVVGFLAGGIVATASATEEPVTMRLVSPDRRCWDAAEARMETVRDTFTIIMEGR